MAEKLFLGVDTGGSKTEALVVNAAGQVLGAGRSGGANYHVIGIEKAMVNVLAAAREALGDHKADYGGFCMTAADTPHDFGVLRGALEGLDLCQQFVLHNDVLAIFRAGSRFPYGVGIVCGSGFNAGGIAKDGREARLPALGPMTGDFSGGGYIGVAAMGAAFRAWDGRGKPTLLQDAILEFLKIPDMDAITERIVQGLLEPRDLLVLSPLVFRICEQGDEVAREIIHTQGIELGTAAAAMLRRLDLLDEPCDVALGGKVFSGEGTLLIDTLSEVVHKVAPKASIVKLDVAPVVGSTLFALDQAQKVDTALINTLKSTLPEYLTIK